MTTITYQTDAPDDRPHRDGLHSRPDHPHPAGSPRCRGCGAGVAVRWQTFRDGTRHLRATCPACGGVTFLPQSAENRPLADAAAEAHPAGPQPAPVVPGDLFTGLPVGDWSGDAA
jgi:hypothetical protein